MARPGLLTSARRPVPARNVRPCWYTAVPAGFPDERTTGVPYGTALTTYTGPTTITTADTVLDGIRTTATINVRAPRVVIRNSRLGGVDTTETIGSSNSVTLLDCEIEGDQINTGLGGVNIVARRCHIHDCRRGVNMWSNVQVYDSIIVDVSTDATAPYNEHQSCARMGDGSVLVRCSLGTYTQQIYDALDGDHAGPSALMTGYGDFATVQNCRVDNVWMPPTEGGYAFYGGYGGGKPFPNANNMRYYNLICGIDPTSQSGTTTGYYGTSSNWAGTNTSGNVFANNRYVDGRTVSA